MNSELSAFHIGAPRPRFRPMHLATRNELCPEGGTSSAVGHCHGLVGAAFHFKFETEALPSKMLREESIFN